MLWTFSVAKMLVNLDNSIARIKKKVVIIWCYCYCAEYNRSRPSRLWWTISVWSRVGYSKPGLVETHVWRKRNAEFAVCWIYRSFLYLSRLDDLTSLCTCLGSEIREAKLQSCTGTESTFIPANFMSMPPPLVRSHKKIPAFPIPSPLFDTVHI